MMGQGAESCGGYELEYDEYEDGLESGVWTQRDGSSIKVSSMSETHIKNTIRRCKMRSRSATFTCDQDKWEEWIDLLENELDRRITRPTSVTIPKARVTIPVPVRGKMVSMICHCGLKYTTREADLKRGWGLSCSKRCASVRRTYGKPPAKREK